MEATERIGLGIPAILLGAVWGAFGLVLEVFVLLNDCRDKILMLRRQEDVTWSAVLWNDWMWLWVGTVAILATVTGVLIYMPRFFQDDGKQAELRKKTVLICYTVAILPAFSAIGFLVGGALDLVHIFQAAP